MVADLVKHRSVQKIGGRNVAGPLAILYWPCQVGIVPRQPIPLLRIRRMLRERFGRLSIPAVVQAEVEGLLARLFVGTGFLGGFTTYSALALDTAALAGAGLAGHAAAYGLGTVVVGAAASLVGILVAARVRRG